MYSPYLFCVSLTSTIKKETLKRLTFDGSLNASGRMMICVRCVMTKEIDPVRKCFFVFHFDRNNMIYNMIIFQGLVSICISRISTHNAFILGPLFFSNNFRPGTRQKF